MTYRMIQVGTGGFGWMWCRRFLPPNTQDGTVEVVAAVDINPEALINAREGLGLRADQCYTNLQQAFDENPADFCTIVVPPAYHEAVVDAALAHDLHILSEKPISNTLEGALRIADKVRNAGKKMAITMSHRFDQDKTTLRHELRSGRHGALDYLILRLAVDGRKFGSYSAFTHAMADPIMIEGAVHHLDLLTDLAGAQCDTIYAQTWTPSWAEYKGDPQALVLLRFGNSTRAFYEGAWANAAELNYWEKEYIRAECELATLILDHRRLECHPYIPGARNRREGQGEEIPLLQQAKWSNAWLIEQFAHWLDGGEPMATNVEANLQAVAMVFAGIESSRTGLPVNVQEYLARVRHNMPSGQAG
jgi:predicted dehydrogenase